MAGLEPVTSAVTGQRSNQLSYTPAQGPRKLGEPPIRVNGDSAEKKIRATDAKEVGVENPAEETLSPESNSPAGLRWPVSLSTGTSVEKSSQTWGLAVLSSQATPGIF